LELGKLSKTDIHKQIAVLALILGLLTHAVSAGAAVVPNIVLAHGALNARIAPLWIAHEQNFC
jgi:hypothetical protein